MTNKEFIKRFFKEKPGYLKKNAVIAANAMYSSTEMALQNTIKVAEIQKSLRKGLENFIPEKIKKLTPLTKPTPKPLKRLFFDIETSPNIVFSWNIGNRISLSCENIVKERAIICICWKWEDEKKVNYLTWDKGDDKKMLTEFAKIIKAADQVVGHNSDQYDIKWVQARAIFHNIPLAVEYKKVDTLKISRRAFRFNSHKLNYIAQYLGLGEKMHVEYNLWKEIVMNNDVLALSKMVKYCQKDVTLLQKVFNRLNEYSKKKL